MIHLSGTFAYQRYVNEVRPGEYEFQPAAFYIAMTMRNDDGTPTFPDDSEVGDIGAWVVMSRPQQLGGPGYGLSLTLDNIEGGYLGFTAEQLRNPGRGNPMKRPAPSAAAPSDRRGHHGSPAALSAVRP